MKMKQIYNKKHTLVTIAVVAAWGEQATTIQTEPHNFGVHFEWVETKDKRATRRKEMVVKSPVACAFGMESVLFCMYTRVYNLTWLNLNLKKF